MKEVVRKWHGRFGPYIETHTVKDKFLYYEYGADSYKPKPMYQRYRAQEKDFENVLIQGKELFFESKRDRTFKRLHAERRKGKSKDNRRAERAAKEKEYSFLCQSELQKKKEKELNNLTITRHGFDLTSSFRGKQNSA